MGIYCRTCGNELKEGQAICLNCGVNVGTGNKFCSNCGKEVNPEAAICLSCGFAIKNKSNVFSNIANAAPKSGAGKSKLVAGLLAIFLGTFGVHNFYLGYQKKALIQLLVALIGGLITCGIASAAMAVWAIVDAVMIFTGKINCDASGAPLID